IKQGFDIANFSVNGSGYIALASHKFLITGNVANQNIGYIALALKKGCELLAGVSQSRDGSRLDLFQQQVLVEKFQQGQPMLRSRAYAQTLYRLPLWGLGGR